MTGKCQSFGNELGNMATKSTTSYGFYQQKPATFANYEQQLRTQYTAPQVKGENWLTRAHRTL